MDNIEKDYEIEYVKEKKPLALYISTGVIDVITTLVMIVLLVIFVLFAIYINSLMSVAGLSSFAGLIYGSLGYTAIGFIVLLISILFGNACIVMEILLFVRLKDLKQDRTIWLLVVNSLVMLLSIFSFLLYLIILLFVCAGALTY